MCLNFYLGLLKTPTIKETKTEIIKRDTIIDWKYSTDTVYFDRIKYKNNIVYDTIHHNDIVYVRDTAVVHRDSTENYTIDISAVKLDWYKLDINHYDTVTYVQTVNNTIYKPKKNNFTLGLSVGYGYAIKSKDLQPFVGITATYNILGK